MDEQKNDQITAAHLCRAARAGDRAAASELLKLYHRKVFAYFRRQCGNDADAQDLTQRTFCKVWAALPGFRGDASFATWIHTISHRVFTDWLRRPDRDESRREDWWADLPEDGPSPFDTASDRELACLLYSIVDTLDHEPRQLIHLHYYQGLSLKETAEVLGIATSTVKYRLRGALQTIRAEARQAEKKTYQGETYHECR